MPSAPSALTFDALRPPSPFMNDTHAAWRAALRKFVERELMPFATEWDDMVVRGSIEDRSFSAFLLKEGRLLSTFSMNRKFDVRRSMPLIATKAHPERARLEDPEFDLRELHPPKE